MSSYDPHPAFTRTFFLPNTRRVTIEVWVRELLYLFDRSEIHSTRDGDYVTIYARSLTDQELRYMEN